MTDEETNKSDSINMDDEKERNMPKKETNKSEDDEKEKKRNKAKKDIYKKILSNQKAAFAGEYAKLTNRFERALIEHKLAVEYYEFRSFYFVFLPLTIIASAITIIGFLLSGNVNTNPPPTEDSEGVQGQYSTQFEPLLTGRSATVWTIAVGILGAISTLLTTIGKHTNYQSKFDMHQSAVKALEKICLTVDFEKDWFDRKASSDDFINSYAKNRLNNPDAAEHDNLAALLGADLKSHQASFEAMQNACCDSPVPTRVIQAFTVLDQEHGKRGSAGGDLMLYYHKLWKEFSVYFLWPLWAPNLNVTEKYEEWNPTPKPPPKTAPKTVAKLTQTPPDTTKMTDYGSLEQQGEAGGGDSQILDSVM